VELEEIAIGLLDPADIACMIKPKCDERCEVPCMIDQVRETRKSFSARRR
jgi:hypothetical protein